jgi:hypothetical protein
MTMTIFVGCVCLFALSIWGRRLREKAFRELSVEQKPANVNDRQPTSSQKGPNQIVTLVEETATTATAFLRTFSENRRFLHGRTIAIVIGCLHKLDSSTLLSASRAFANEPLACPS